MTAPRTTITRVREPVWLRDPRPMQIAAIVLIVAAGVTDLCLVVLKAGSPIEFGGVAITMGGALLHRRLPRVAVQTASIGAVIVSAAGWNPIAEWTIIVFTLFATTSRGMRPLPIAAIAAAIAYLAEVIHTASWNSIDSLAAATAVFAGAILGTALEVHRRFWESLEQRAEDALATRELEAERRVAQERLRIARDLHDVVGHQVAVLSMQLGAIEVTTRPDDPAREHVAAARTSVKAVLLETQRILDILRTPAEADVLHPTPGVRSLADLVDSMRQAGLQVDATLEVPYYPLDPSVDVAIYRIVQEALTNAQRHGSGTASLKVIADESRITLDVDNTIVAASPSQGARTRYGLVGMRERTLSAGGVISAEQIGDRFAVHAAFTLDGSQIR